MQFDLTLRFYLHGGYDLKIQKQIAQIFLDSPDKPTDWFIEHIYLIASYQHEASNKSEAFLHGNFIGETFTGELKSQGIELAELRSVEAIPHSNQPASDSTELTGQALTPSQARIICAQLEGMKPVILQKFKTERSCSWKIGQTLNAIRTTVLNGMALEDIAIFERGAPALDFDITERGHCDLTLTSSEALQLWEQLYAIVSMAVSDEKDDD